MKVKELELTLVQANIWKECSLAKKITKTNKKSKNQYNCCIDFFYAFSLADFNNFKYVKRLFRK